MNALFFWNTKYFSLLAIALTIFTGCSSEDSSEDPEFEKNYASKLSISPDDESTLHYHCHIRSRTSGKSAAQIIGGSVEQYRTIFNHLVKIAVNRPDFNYLTMKVTYHWEYMSYEGAWREKSLPTLEKVPLQRLREFHKNYKLKYPKSLGYVSPNESRQVSEWLLSILKTAGHDTRDLEWDIKEGIRF